MHSEWRKSSFSGSGAQDCVEVSYSTEVHLRDSKNPDGGILRVPLSSWAPHLLARTE